MKLTLLDQNGNIVWTGTLVHIPVTGNQVQFGDKIFIVSQVLYYPQINEAAIKLRPLEY
jgi:hypothetical protein